jgi:hypothetical protein
MNVRTAMPEFGYLPSTATINEGLPLVPVAARDANYVLQKLAYPGFYLRLEERRAMLLIRDDAPSTPSHLEDGPPMEYRYRLLSNAPGANRTFNDIGWSALQIGDYLPKSFGEIPWTKLRFVADPGRSVEKAADGATLTAQSSRSAPRKKAVSKSPAAPVSTAKPRDAPKSVYQLDRNDVAGALAFVRANWGRLRPEDFSILRQLQDKPTKYLRALDELEAELLPRKGKPLRTRGR